MAGRIYRGNKGVTLEEYDLPGLKTANGIAALGGIKEEIVRAD